MGDELGANEDDLMAEKMACGLVGLSGLLMVVQKASVEVLLTADSSAIGTVDSRGVLSERTMAALLVRPTAVQSAGTRVVPKGPRRA